MDYKAQYDERKANVLNLLKKTIVFYTRLNDEEKKSSLTDLYNAVENGKFSIVVVGQFSAGKSTFLNALMGEKYLPSFTTETTATINFLRSVNESPTKKPLIKINYKDGHSEQCEEVTLENIEKYVSTKGDDVAKKILSVEVFLDSKYLNDGVSLVDSPGLNGILEGHEQITNEQINRSHAAIFMFNAKQPGSKSDFEKLNMLLQRCDSVLIVLNQKDLIKTEEQTIEDVVQQLKQNYAKYFNTDQLPEIYPISSYQALVARSERQLDYNGKTEFNQSQKEDLLDDSAIEVFEERLSKYLTQGEKAQKELLSPIEKVRTFLTETKNSITNRIEQLRNTTDTDEVRLQIKQLKDELDTLHDKLNNNHTDIRNKVGEILRSTEIEIKGLTADTKTKCLKQIDDAEDLEELENNAQRYVSLIKGKYYQICEDATSKAENRVLELITNEYNQYASSIEQRLNEKKGTNKIVFSEINFDSTIFESDFNMDDYMSRRDEIKKAMQENEEHLDHLEEEGFKARRNEDKRNRLEKAKAQIRKEYNDERELLGERPDIQTYEVVKNRKVGGLKGLGKWIYNGSREEQYFATERDDSAQKYYDQLRREIEENRQRELEDLERQRQNIPEDNLGLIELKIKQKERANERYNQELKDLEEKNNKDKAKYLRKKQRKAQNYLENLIEDIEREGLKKIYEMLRGYKDVQTNAILDVLQTELQSVINRKKEDVELLEKQLSSSQKEKDKLIEELSSNEKELELILEESAGYKSEINSIKTDKIERA